MAASSARTGGAITGINVTPLVDITLVLLIIFMVTARLVARAQTVAVDLPKAATGEGIQEIIGIQLFTDGRTIVNGVPVASDGVMVQAALEVVRRSRSARAVIQADGAVPHARVIDVLDRLRGAGIVKVGFGVAPKLRAAEP
jgi:biopolymer transport protein ExbD